MRRLHAYQTVLPGIAIGIQSGRPAPSAASLMNSVADTEHRSAEMVYQFDHGS
jgi:hypothetical protein